MHREYTPSKKKKKKTKRGKKRVMTKMNGMNYEIIEPDFFSFQDKVQLISEP